MNDQTILRKPHNTEHPYVVVSKTVFEDDSISWKAKGLMGYLLSRPDDWKVIIGDLVKRSTDGRDSVRSALAELETHGYLTKSQERGEDGRWQPAEMIIHECPRPERKNRSGKTAADNPSTEKPSTDYPPTENPTLLSTDVPSTDVPSTDLPSTEREGASAPALPAEQEPEQERSPPKKHAWKIPHYTGLMPACAVYKSATGYRPEIGARQIINDAIPNDYESLHNWYRVCQGWILTGYNYRNVAGMLEWYKEGRVGRDKPRGNGRHDTPHRGEVQVTDEMMRIYRENLGDRLHDGTRHTRDG